MEYIIQKINMHNLPVSAGTPGMFGIPDGLNPAPISQFVWDEFPYHPNSAAYVGWHEDGLEVWLISDEQEIRMQCRNTGDMVCQDSCLEFFLKPVPGLDAMYVNYECSPYPCVFFSIGKERQGRTTILEIPYGMEPESKVIPGVGWCIHYTITAAFLKEYFGCDLHSGMIMEGNFYKCGDLTNRPHYGSWSPVDKDKYHVPDFHRPEYFGKLILS